jgi:D-alanyl-D-alanine carboxypeptidase/D-alanyl-D-alanine-endopeptidase (penicillin-binding protein 4)
MSPSVRPPLAALVVFTVVVAGILVVRGPVDATEPEPPTATPLATPVLSPRRMPAMLASAITDRQVRDALQPVIDQARPDTCIVVTDHGRVIIDRSPGPLEPASTVKLLTAVTVLDQLDPDGRLQTTVHTAKRPSDGVIEGDLYLVGGGDPVLTTPGYQVSFTNRDQLTNDFGALADRIVQAGVREIRGGVLADDSRYDRVRWVASWPERYQNQGFVGPLSALMVNDGQTGYTAAPEAPATHRVPGDPPMLAAETLRTLLTQRGVRIGGGASLGAPTSDAPQLAALESPTIRDLVGQMLVESDDTTAELLTKELGLQIAGEGSTAAGVRVILDHLRDIGMPTDGLVLNDGSGLDEGNRATCALMTAVLDRGGPESELARLLPVAGENGTLRPRLRRTPAQGRVLAKTGTLDFVNALAGFAQTADGSWLTFAYDVVGPDQPRGYVPVDEFAIALVGVPRGPDLTQLAPKQP